MAALKAVGGAPCDPTLLSFCHVGCDRVGSLPGLQRSVAWVDVPPQSVRTSPMLSLESLGYLT